MAAGAIEFSDLFDVAVSVSQKLSIPLQKTVPVQLLTNDKNIFDIISKGFRTSEKCTMIDIAAAREGFKSEAIYGIGSVRN